jgi:NarL family two-component system sensor histidine kinase LiaS
MNTEVHTRTDGAARPRRVHLLARDPHSRSGPRLAPNPPAGNGGASTAVMTERARIARELHDTVLQTLYTITLTASRALRMLPTQDFDAAQSSFEEVLRLANGGQTELRALLTNVRSDSPDARALTNGLAALGADSRARSGIDVRLSLAEEPRVPVATKEALLLTAREALHNAIRHAGATHVDLALEVACGQLVLLISDHGRGFDPSVHRPGHFGLQSMRERVAAVGGALELMSANGVGAQVRVCVPVQRQCTVDSSAACSA